MSFSLHSFQPLSALSWSQDGYAEFKMDTISNTKELQNQWWAQHKANSETKMQLLITPLVLYFETLLTPKISWMMAQDAHCEYWYWHVWLSLSSNDMTTLCRVMCLYLKCQALRIVCFFIQWWICLRKVCDNHWVSLCHRWHSKSHLKEFFYSESDIYKSLDKEKIITWTQYIPQGK